MNIKDEVKAIVTDPVLQQRLAKYLVLRCFRNSVLDDLHAGTAAALRADHLRKAARMVLQHADLRRGRNRQSIPSSGAQPTRVIGCRLCAT